jgi:imidazole glycerol-phosphate synthase subunit HisH
MIFVVDVGLGNIGSLLNMLGYLGIEARATASAEDLRAATRLLLPGVGAFDNGMRRLEESGLIPVLRQRVVHDKIPLLGICLGMQLLGHASEEGTLPGLGFLPMRTRRFAFSGGSPSLRVPHMGWNVAEPAGSASPLHAVPTPRRFYFVHSYHVVCEDPACIAGVTRYGIDFTSAVRSENIWGVQFHAEKSHRYGMALLEHFIRHG